jgi:hypothetical protein
VIDATAVIGTADATAENALTTTVQITGAQEAAAATMAGAVAPAATMAGAVAQLQAQLTAEPAIAQIILAKMGALNAIHQIIIITTTTHQAVVTAGLPPLAAT